MPKKNYYIPEILQNILKPQGIHCRFNHSYEDEHGLLTIRAGFTKIKLNRRQQKNLFAILLQEFGEPGDES